MFSHHGIYAAYRNCRNLPQPAAFHLGPRQPFKTLVVRELNQIAMIELAAAAKFGNSIVSWQIATDVYCQAFKTILTSKLMCLPQLSGVNITLEALHKQ